MTTGVMAPKMPTNGAAASLTALKAELESMIMGCRLGNVATCLVIEVLAEHGQCAHARH
jgi:hypothetical protein